MKKGVSEVWAPHTDEHGQGRWPEAMEARNELASQLLGACLVDAMDGWVEPALDVLRSPEATPAQLRTRVQPELEDERRRVFATLSPEQRRHVEELLFHTVHGALFSALVSLDQFPGGLVDIVVLDPDTSVHIASIAEGSIFHLHDRLGGWIEEFSEYPENYEPASSKGRPTKE